MTDEEFIAALRAVDSATVANAIEALGVRDPAEGYADLRLRCLVAQREPMVGYAVTVKVDSTTPGLTPDRSRLSGLIEAVSRSPKPCVVVAEEAGPSPERGCHMGDVVATMLARIGVVGAVSGSGIRDVAGIRELGLTAFALGTVVGRGPWTIMAVGTEVEVAGLRVRNGDLLHGNGDGLVSVPRDAPAELLRHIAAVRTKELNTKQRVSGEAESAYPR
jgi:4-hydroxy-4-methyl-2-oxoglutarate aldolase